MKSVLLVVAFALGCSAAQPLAHQTAGQDVKDAGTKTKNAAKKGTQATVNGTKKATGATVHGVKKGTNKAASVTESGANKLKNKTNTNTQP